VIAYLARQEYPTGIKPDPHLIRLGLVSICPKPRVAHIIAAVCENDLNPSNARFSYSVENECNPHLSFEQDRPSSGQKSADLHHPSHSRRRLRSLSTPVLAYQPAESKKITSCVAE
jgi:hypothetical protein